MSELIFESSLTMEEIERKFQDTDFFTGIWEGLEEAIAFKIGTASSETGVHKRSLPGKCR